MAQNVYDTPSFFDSYLTLPRSRLGLQGMPEWPSLCALLPPIDSASHILDLGCGMGWFARWARSHGAASVTAIDLSANMLHRATELGRADGTDDPRLRYVKADLETLALDAESLSAGSQREGDQREGGPAKFDLVVSQLALHYVVHIERLLAQVYAALIPGGTFVFSVEHPILTAPTPSTKPQWILLPDEPGREARRAWPLDGYAREGERRRVWMGEAVAKQHRMLGTWIHVLIAAGFVIEALVEWVPTREQIETDTKEDGVLEWMLERPVFLLVRVRKPVI